jgi:hypothetical protein
MTENNKTNYLLIINDVLIGSANSCIFMVPTPHQYTPSSNWNVKIAFSLIGDIIIRSSARQRCMLSGPLAKYGELTFTKSL